MPFLLGLLGALARPQVTQAQSQGAHPHSQPSPHPQNALAHPDTQHPATIKKITYQEADNDLSFPVIVLPDAADKACPMCCRPWTPISISTIVFRRSRPG